MIQLYYTLLEGDCSYKAQHEAGLALLRLCVSGEAVKIRPGGQPFIPGAPEFSISHSGALVLLAVSDAGRIGCDVEWLHRRIRNPEAIRKKLAPTPEEQALGLLQLWVRREAIFKSGGAGGVFYPAMPEEYIAAVACAVLPEGAILPQHLPLGAPGTGGCIPIFAPGGYPQKSACKGQC
ncbi:MAG: hypothetical protein LBS96_03950 [Oscillospiraceae bacterium]|nr:hypothetical protein [Oscillospiraceae bacterium]